MNRLIRKAKNLAELDLTGKYERFDLLENPFPAHPYVNQESTDKRINGDVYEMEIRKNEYDRIRSFFLQSPQSDANHLRLGYIMDTSYVGRGNGKSAFLVNLQHDINREYCIDISDEINKCFAVYVTPLPSGQTKSFANLLDLIFQAIARSSVIDDALTMLRFEAVSELSPEIAAEIADKDAEDLVASLSDEQWYADNKIDTEGSGTNAR